MRRRFGVRGDAVVVGVLVGVVVGTVRGGGVIRSGDVDGRVVDERSDSRPYRRPQSSPRGG
ncbi:MAG TPA: hypothetical protein VE127_00265 [Solirubrobacteraceae bacterium]|nr:hypothetical protein [Solirubrobacteraceae bacterium]